MRSPIAGNDCLYPSQVFSKQEPVAELTPSDRLAYLRHLPFVEERVSHQPVESTYRSCGYLVAVL